MTRMKRVKLELTIEVPVLTGESEVENSINSALDEPPCDWEDWIVGAATIVHVSDPYEGE